MFDTSAAAGRDPATSGLLAELDAAEAAVARAESCELAGRPVGELVDAVPRCDRLVTRLQLLSARALAAVPVEAEPTVFDPFADSPPDPAQVTAHELGLALTTSADSVRNRLSLAETITADLPLVAAAAAAGHLKWWQVREAADAILGLTPKAVAQVDARLADAARAGRCRSRFTATLQRIVIAADPAKAEQRRAQGVADRRIWFKPVGDGMSAFGGLMPAENAVTLAACLTRLAPTPIAAPPVTCDAGGRTLAQARVDALAGLADRFLDHLLDPPRTPTPQSTIPRRTTPPPTTTSDTGSTAITVAGSTDSDAGAAAHSGDTDSADPDSADPARAHPDRADTAGAETDRAETDRAETGRAETGRAETAGADTAKTQRAARRAARRARRRAARQEDRLNDVLTRMTAAGLLSEAALSPDAPSRADADSAPSRRRGRPTGEIRVTVSAETLLGISQNPGDLDGYGPITAAHARRLAHRPGTTWRRLLTDPVSGTALDLGRTRYRPPEALADLIRTRYGGHCDRPGCTHQGRDLDHALPWESGGDTSDRNLHPVCRGCHTAKHRGWLITLHDDHTVTWTDPHGHTATTRPADHRPEDHYPREPAPVARSGTGNPHDPWNGDPDDPPPF